MTPRPLRLGLLSTARISARVLGAAAERDDVEVAAVGGRHLARARAFAAAHGVPRALGTYEALLADAGVDAVYVALPGALHAEWALRAVRAQKHVLVEKSLSSDAAAVDRLFAAAQTAGVVVAEAFMWRHHPQAERLARIVADGTIGDLRHVRAGFSFVLDRPDDIRWDASLGGGSLLDVGTYCVNAARLLAGEPETVVATAARHPTGVDVRFAAVMRHPGDVLSTFTCGFDTPYHAVLEAVGTEGAVRLPDPWHATRPVIEIVRGHDLVREELPPTDAYRAELDDLVEAVRGGRPPRLGRSESVGQARALGLLIDAAA